MQLHPHSSFSIRWDKWSAWSLHRFTHSERVSGTHFTGHWIESRAGLSSGKLKIHHAWRKKNEISLSHPIRSLVGTETCLKSWTATVHRISNALSNLKATYHLVFFNSGSLLRTKTTKKCAINGAPGSIRNPIVNNYRTECLVLRATSTEAVWPSKQVRKSKDLLAPSLGSSNQRTVTSLNLKMMALLSFELSVTIYRTTFSNITEDFILQQHRCENLKSLVMFWDFNQLTLMLQDAINSSDKKSIPFTRCHKFH